MKSQPDGFWEGVIQGLTAGREYEFLITKGDDITSVEHRMDPAARDTHDSDLGNKQNKSIVVDARHSWSPFQMPPFDDHSYGVRTGQSGKWSQILCSQDAWFGGWDGAGNACYEPFTQSDGKVYINVPKWSVTMFRLA